MSRAPRRPSWWFVVFCLFFGIGVGFLIATVAMSFWAVFAGEEAHRGLFALVWMIASVIFFAWPMHVVARAYAVKRQSEVTRQRIGDLDYEPPTLPVLGTRAPGPTDDLRIKAPDIGEGRFRKLLARGRTAEQRMADHLMTLEIQAEMQKAREGETGKEPAE